MTDEVEIEDGSDADDCDGCVTLPVVAKTADVVTTTPDDRPPAETTVPGTMAVGECRFGVTACGEPLGRSHWLADSSICGDLVMALPSSVLIASRTQSGGGVAVDMAQFLDAVMEGTAKMIGYPGIAEAAAIPIWAVSRLFGTFPVMRAIYDEAMDQAVMLVEAAAIKAATGGKVTNTRKVTKSKTGINGPSTESTTETLVKDMLPDPMLSKLILTSRMKNRYKDEGGLRQAVQINILGAEARL